MEFLLKTETCENKLLKEYKELWYNHMLIMFNEFKSPEYICKVHERTKYDNLTINILWNDFIESNMLQIVNKNIFNYELEYKKNKNIIEVILTKKTSKYVNKEENCWYGFIYTGVLKYINTVLKTFGWELIYYNKDNILFLPIRIKLFDYRHRFLLQDDFITGTTNKIKEIKIKSIMKLYCYPINFKTIIDKTDYIG